MVESSHTAASLFLISNDTSVYRKQDDHGNAFLSDIFPEVTGNKKPNATTATNGNEQEYVCDMLNNGRRWPLYHSALPRN